MVNRNMQPHIKIETLLTMQCNYQCLHCSSRSTPKSDGDIDIEFAKRVLEEFSTSEKKQHTIGGGEPLLRPQDLQDLAKFSLKLGFKTLIVTNSYWVDPKNPRKTKEFLKNYIPENTKIMCSYDFFHLQMDPRLYQKIELLKKLTENRNRVSIFGSYNGTKEYELLMKQLSEFDGKITLTPMQSIGRASLLSNKNTIQKPCCPKGEQEIDFVIAFNGLWACIPGALDNIKPLRLTEEPNMKSILQGLKTLEEKNIGKRIQDFYNSPKGKKFAHPCDICRTMLK